MPTAVRPPATAATDLDDWAPTGWANGDLVQWQSGQFIPIAQADLANASQFRHVQAVPATIWVVNHNLGRHPAVSVLDSAGTLVEGAVVHETFNRLVITFSLAFSGEANCN